MKQFYSDWKRRKALKPKNLKETKVKNISVAFFRTFYRSLAVGKKDNWTTFAPTTQQNCSYAPLRSILAILLFIHALSSISFSLNFAWMLQFFCNLNPFLQYMCTFEHGISASCVGVRVDCQIQLSCCVTDANSWCCCCCCYAWLTNDK